MVVPLFFVAMVPFLYLMRIVLACIVLESALQEGMSQIAVSSYLLQRVNVLPDQTEDSEEEYTLEDLAGNAAELDSLTDAVTSAFDSSLVEQAGEEAAVDIGGIFCLQSMMESSVSEEELTHLGVEGGWQGISFLGSRFFYQEEASGVSHGYLLRGEMTVTFDDPFAFWDIPKAHLVRVCHAFTGEKDAAASSAGEEESSGDQETVYKIGSNGTKYHQLGCYLIDKEIHSMDRQTAVSEGYERCSRCGGGSGTVYVTSGGEKFHTKDCAYLYPDLTPMTKKEAQEAGLSPCGLCYGGEGYFR